MRWSSPLLTSVLFTFFVMHWLARDAFFCQQRGLMCSAFFLNLCISSFPSPHPASSPKFHNSHSSFRILHIFLLAMVFSLTYAHFLFQSYLSRFLSVSHFSTRSTYKFGKSLSRSRGSDTKVTDPGPGIPTKSRWRVSETPKHMLHDFPTCEAGKNKSKRQWLP